MEFHFTAAMTCKILSTLEPANAMLQSSAILSAYDIIDTVYERLSGFRCEEVFQRLMNQILLHPIHKKEIEMATKSRAAKPKLTMVISSRNQRVKEVANVMIFIIPLYVSNYFTPLLTAFSVKFRHALALRTKRW